MVMPLKAVVLNDTRRAREHLGCMTVMSNLLHLLRLHGIEVIRSIEPVEAVDTDEFRESLERADLVVVNGEGTMHHDAKAATDLIRAAEFAKLKGKKTALVNSVWQENSTLNDGLRWFDFLAVRDSASQRECSRSSAARVWLAPDLSFYSNPLPPDLPNRGTELPRNSLLVVDSVLPRTAIQLYDYAANHQLPFRVMVTWHWQKEMDVHPIARSLPLNLGELKHAELLLTGRFHAVCLAMKYGIPFVALPSNTRKVETLLEDAGLPFQDFLLPSDWPHRSPEYWVNYARALNEQHRATINSFVTSASSQIEAVFQALNHRLAAEAPHLVPANQPSYVDQ